MYESVNTVEELTLKKNVILRVEAEQCVSACTCAHFSQQPGKVDIIVIALVSRLSAKAQTTGLGAETVKSCF